MSEIQRYKIVDTDTGDAVFFTDRAFNSATNLVRDYVHRNKAKTNMKVYFVNHKGFGDHYTLIDTITKESKE